MQARNPVIMWGINMFYVQILLQLLSICIAFTYIILNVKEKNVNGFAGWLTAFTFEVAFYGKMHGLLFIN